MSAESNDIHKDNTIKLVTQVMARDAAFHHP